MTDDDFWAGTSPPPRRKAEPMSGMADEIAGRLKELFYAYTNRSGDDNRSAQKHLGPSQIGTPCDRRIAMSLLDIPAVNPGGDGWAAFVGTCMHAGLADMFDWANHGTGRYATEVRVALPSPHVPKGTADLLDRVLYMVADHKGMGASSLSKLRLDGLTPLQRVQANTYAYGAIQAGERVEHIAIVGWPREAASLKGLHVHVEPYDESVAVDALARVDRIAADIAYRGDHLFTPLEVARSFPTADDCFYCPFKTNTDMGCRGHGR